MANAKHFTKAETRPVACTYVSITIYKSKCEKGDILINHWAIPRDIWKVMEEEKTAEKQGRWTKKQQQQLLTFETITGPREFMRGAVLNAVTKLIATNNEVSHYCFIMAIS